MNRTHEGCMAHFPNEQDPRRLYGPFPQRTTPIFEYDGTLSPYASQLYILTQSSSLKMYCTFYGFCPILRIHIRQKDLRARRSLGFNALGTSQLFSKLARSSTPTQSSRHIPREAKASRVILCMYVCILNGQEHGAICLIKHDTKGEKDSRQPQ
jgi:hypothetical protein